MTGQPGFKRPGLLKLRERFGLGPRCPSCRSYAWSDRMAPVTLAGVEHHPSCPDVRQLDDGQTMLRGGRLVRPFA